MRAALALAAVLALAAPPARAQGFVIPFETPAVAPPAAEAAPAPRRERRAPRQRSRASRPSDPRDRAFMDGGAVSAPGFAAPAPMAAPRPELAPRPNLDLEGPNVARVPRPGEPAVAPTLINPRVPGRSDAQDGGASMRENRFLQTPAPGLRVTTPMQW